MAECVYRRQGQGFRAFLSIIANPGDTVTLTAADISGIPEEYLNPFVMGDAGKLVIVVKKKGDYTVSGNESGVVKTVSVLERRKDYEADVSFTNAVTVNANPNVTITLTNYDGVTRAYSGTANSSGVATVTVKRRGSYTITTSASSSNTSLSTSPVSVDTLTCDTNKATPTINHVRVSNIASNSVVMASSTGLNVRCTVSASVASMFSGGYCRYATSEPSSLSNGTLLFSSGTTGTTGALTNGMTYYFKVWPYLTINSTSYYGAPSTVAKRVTTTNISNQAYSSSGSIIIPEGCSVLAAFIVGGGGGGGSSNSYSGRNSGNTGGGGGSGYTQLVSSYGVTPGQTLSWTVGGGGSPTANGGATYLYYAGSAIASVGGGYHGEANWYVDGVTLGSGGNGGSGGGAGGWRSDTGSSNYTSYSGTAGASNGGSASGNRYSNKWGSFGGAGAGSGTFVYNNVTYAGGGGGGGVNGWDSNSAAAGGAGGGGAGSKWAGSSGTAGTGGGGGGAGCGDGGYGGSGCVVFSLY